MPCRETVRWEAPTERTSPRDPQLINVGRRTQLWSQPSEAVLASALSFKSENRHATCGALNVTLLEHEKQSLEAK